MGAAAAGSQPQVKSCTPLELRTYSCSDPIHGGPRADSQTRRKRKSARKSPGENEKNKEIDEQAAGRPATAMRGAGSS